MTTLGINTNNLTIKTIQDLGFDRAEVCLGRAGSYQERLEKILHDIDQCKQRGISFSIHLPVYLKESFQYDYLAAFFLDQEQSKRELSFEILKENIEKLSTIGADFFVLHFPGIYLGKLKIENFDQLLTDSLDKINALATKHEVNILLEYFGSNRNFSDYEEWIERIANYSNIGILLDTGHLYFASLLNNFNFDTAFEALSKHADAFHLWTTKGDKPYKANKFYKNYHHIPMTLDQYKKDGWAFDSKKMIDHLKSLKKPVIIEASEYFKGRQHFIKSVKEVKEYFEEKPNQAIIERSL